MMSKLLSSVELFEGRPSQNIIDWLDKWQRLIQINKLNEADAINFLLSKVSPEI